MNDIPNAAADIINRIMQTAKAAVPDSLSNDVRENVKAAIQDIISDLDVVTREELDTQKAVLAKTRAKVDEMESVIADLEKRLNLDWVSERCVAVLIGEHATTAAASTGGATKAVSIRCYGCAGNIVNDKVP